jgi:hypothetical protein
MVMIRRERSTFSESTSRMMGRTNARAYLMYFLKRVCSIGGGPPSIEVYWEAGGAPSRKIRWIWLNEDDLRRYTNQDTVPPVLKDWWGRMDYHRHSIDDHAL